MLSDSAMSFDIVKTPNKYRETEGRIGRKFMWFASGTVPKDLRNY